MGARRVFSHLEISDPRNSLGPGELTDGLPDMIQNSDDHYFFRK